MAPRPIGFNRRAAGRLYLPLTRDTQGITFFLAILRRFVHLMEGEIHVESMPDEGSAFCIKLPDRERA